MGCPLKAANARVSLVSDPEMGTFDMPLIILQKMQEAALLAILSYWVGDFA